MSESSLSLAETLLSPGSEGLQKLAASVTADYKRWKQARAGLECRWRECWEAYLCDVRSLYAQPDDDTGDRSRIARPVLYEAVEAIHANLLNALFPANERFFTVVGRTEDDHRNAGLIEEFLRTKLEEAGFLEKYALFLKQAIITGNSVAAAPWKKNREVRRVEQPVEVFGVTVGYRKVNQEVVVYNGPDFEVIDMFDFMIDPDATDFERAKVIHRVERSLRELKANPAYINLDALENARQQNELEPDPGVAARRRVFGLDTPVEAHTADGADRVEVLEAWGDFVVDDRLYTNYVCVVANGNTVLRFEPNPYDSGLKPFVFTGFIPVPNEIYGIGAIEKSLGLQHAINTLTNQKLDVINLSINSPFTYLINDDVFDPETMVTRPGALIPVKSHDTLRPIQYLNNFTVAFNEIADLKAEVQEATGAFKYFTGGDSPQSRTATEVSALITGGTQKFSYFLSHLEHASLSPFLNIVFENARQFLREPEHLRVCRQDGVVTFRRVLPEIMRNAQCNFKIDGSRGLLFKEQEVKGLLTFLQLVESAPDLRAKIDRVALYKKIYRRLGFSDEAEIFIAADPGMPVPLPQPNEDAS